MDLIESLYVAFGVLIIGVVMLYFGYTRNEENRARIKRFAFKKNFGVINIIHKGSWVKRIVHNFDNELIEIGKGEAKKAFVIDKTKIFYEENLPVAYFVEDDASTADFPVYNQTVPVSPAVKDPNVYPVPPSSLESVIQTIITRAMARAAMRQSTLMKILQAAAVIISIVVLIMVFKTMGDVQSISNNQQVLMNQTTEILRAVSHA